MSALEQVPDWLLRPLPTNAVVDAELHAKIDALALKLPSTLAQLNGLLDAHRYRGGSEYDTAANLAAAHVWQKRHLFLAADSTHTKTTFLAFANGHLVPQAAYRVIRRFSKDIDREVRTRARRVVGRGQVREVALPAKRDGVWDATGWLNGSPGDAKRHESGKRVLERHGLPVLTTLRQVRELLGIQSEAQLGYFLLASDANDGPYTTFEIDKSSGGKRLICAPKKQLRWVQRMILDKILARVPAHDAAHGFVPGRSTVTNARPHLGAELLLKFDLTEFFPTIHYYRVVGMFASLGYHIGDGRFGTANGARQVAPTLARLCCYTPDPTAWGAGTMPQGAPTSPALSNLVCRRLDARLTGLATTNAGIYTRYADDLTFSFAKVGGLNVGRFRWWVDQVCHQEGFFVNQAKFRVIRRSQRQMVTGIVVNESLAVPREDRRRFRAILHNCAKHGVESQARGNARFAEYLRGFASYVHMVDADDGAELLERVAALLGPEGDE